MKKTWIMMLVVIATLFVLTGCEEEFPASPSEPSKPSEPARASDLEIVTLISDEWKQTDKAFALANPAARETCAVECHDGAAFSTGEFIPGNHFTGIDCQACHAGKGKELMETGVAKVPFMAEPVKVGEAAACVSCHHGRRDTAAAFQTYADGKATGFTYPHYGAYALVSGEGGMEYPDITYATSTLHANLDCISCHMPEIDGYVSHTFKPDPNASCASCHPGLKDFNFNSGQDKIKTMLDEVEKAILESTKTVFVGSAHGSLVFQKADGTELTPQEVPIEAYVAAYNWYMIKGDGSYGVHNPQYAKSLLQESYKKLTGKELQ